MRVAFLNLTALFSAFSHAHSPTLAERSQKLHPQLCNLTSRSLFVALCGKILWVKTNTFWYRYGSDIKWIFLTSFYYIKNTKFSSFLTMVKAEVFFVFRDTFY